MKSSSTLRGENVTYRLTAVQAYATSEKFFNELSGALDNKIPNDMKIFVDPGDTKKITENPIITIWFGYPIGNGSIEIPIKYDAAMFRSLRDGDGVVAHVLSNLPMILSEFRYLADDIRASADALIGSVNTLLMMPPEEEHIMVDELEVGI